MKKCEDFELMSLVERRRFLQVMGVLLGAPFVPSAFRFACNEILMGEALAQANEINLPTYFVELNLRDQWDFGHAFVAPGLATHANLQRGAQGKKVALFQDPSTLRRAGSNFFLTNEGLPLEPHLANIAAVELCELSMGTIHGHESANATRSPGRSYTAGAGRYPMWLLDPHAKEGGHENHFSSTPTPAILHNYNQIQLNSGARRGVAYKGNSRDIHTTYHFAAGLDNAQLDRFQSTESLIDSFKISTSPATGVLASHATTIASLMKRVDRTFLDRLKYAPRSKVDHQTQIDGMYRRLTDKSTFDLTLAQGEIDYWKAGVPEEGREGPKAQIWEQVGFASKLLTNNLVKTVSLEFDYVDVHDNRPESTLRAMGSQLSLPLSRLIENLKNAGIWDRTLIAVYTLDGGRSPASDSTGTEGKNGVILAGGRIRGGYYGDIRVAGGTSDGGHTYRYHKPDDSTGVAISSGTTGNDRRVSGASIWKTAMKAAGVPSRLYNSFADVTNAPELNYLINS
ncbi:MAG: DUF1501 domain-containing protein [Bdellovibrionia bacterium]